MKKQVGEYYIENGNICPRRDLVEEINSTGISIYEVIRLVDGKPLFLKDHLQRFQNSCIRSGFTVSAYMEQILQDVNLLIEKNNQMEGNMKLLFCFMDNKLSWKFFFIPYKYPETDAYKNGVVVDILQMERMNPTIKTVQQNVRGKANDLIKEQGLYEVLLVDNEGKIREGSRSNVFFIKGDEITTPPSGSVLPGITRKKVFELISQYGFHFKEEEVQLGNISTYDAIFLTGTSPKVLSIQKVGDYSFDPINKIYQKILNGFNQLILDDIKGAEL